ncbi:MAG TPA: universal stress protein [Actinocrinis sp.]|nr:universal stress protein [Actinocrinis sp.]
MSTAIRGKPVIVGVDASQHAARAALWAAQEAAERNAPLHVIHSTDLDPGPDRNRPKEHRAAADQAAGVSLLSGIGRLVRDKHPTLEVTTAMVRESAASALIAAGRDSDLVVVGTRGPGEPVGMLLGTVSLRVAAHSYCTTVLVRAKGDQNSRSGEILLGMQDGEPQEAVMFAFAQAARGGVGVRAVHAWEPDPSYDRARIDGTDIIDRQALHQMTVALKAAREMFPGVPVRIGVERGHVSAVLAEAARTARLTVVSTHRGHGPLSLGAGIIHGLLSVAPSPVAVVPVA